MLQDFSLAIGQLPDRRFRKVLLLGVGLTIALLAALTYVVFLLIGWAVPETISLLGWSFTWADTALSWLGLVVMIILSIVLMVPVAAAFTGIFLDEVAEAVEERYYPGLSEVPHLPFWDTLKDAMGLIGVTVAINLVALILLIFIGPLAPILFWAVNGYLLGREFFQMAAMRRIGRVAATELRKRHGFKVWMAGTVMAMPLSIPLVNLFIPVIGAATFTHMYHRLKDR